MARSNSYQHIWNEVIVDYSDPAYQIMIDAHGLPTPSLSEEYYKLEEEAYARLREVAWSILTKHQREVLELTYLGLTQKEIAKELSCHQSSIHKTIHGNPATATSKKHGGSSKKIAKALLQDEPFRLLIFQISQLEVSSFLLGTIRHLFPTDQDFQKWLDPPEIIELNQ
jgi:hypothetical protein